MMALGAMCAINEAGIKIGKDIALVGFDGGVCKPGDSHG